jgi:hypothetical protein
MGADSVVVCYGLRYSIGLDEQLRDDALALFEEQTDPRMVAARKAGLRSYFGKVTDGGEYFLLIGTVIGTFGVEGRESIALEDARVTELMKDTQDRLDKAGLEGTPAFHVQLEAQY